MKKLPYVSLCVVLALSVSCSSNKENNDDKNKTKDSVTIAEDNPFLHPSELPFQAPDFTKIESSDFLPAFNEGISRKLEEIEQIATNKEKPTFENTLVALEKSGQMLGRVSGVFYLLAGANTNDTLKEVEKLMAPKLASLSDAIYLNDQLFQRVKSIYDTRKELNLDGEAIRLVELYYNRFKMAGAELSDKDKTKLKELNKKGATLRTQFANLLFEAGNNAAFFTSNKEDLEGLSEGELKAAAQRAKDAGKEGQWMIPMINTTQQPVLTNLTNREVRKAIFTNSINRAEQGDENDTRETIIQLAELRAQKAKLLDFENFATWKLQNQMAKEPSKVIDFMKQLAEPATKQAKKEAKELHQLMVENGVNDSLQPWDWNFYAEKLRKKKYDINEEKIKPYFELNNVLKNGVFFAANKLYGITFKERNDIPVYHEDVTVYEVIDSDGSSIGLFYGDFYKRESKRGGAWMSNIVEQSTLLGTKPVIYNVCNYPKPAEGEPALISWDNVVTLFHEFGHSLHGLFASQKYPSVSGTATPRDFVEFPSQFNEFCATDPVIFANYAVHYKTGEPMPEELINKIQEAANFNQGYMFTELVAAAMLDMQWHTITNSSQIEDVDAFEEKALKTTNLFLNTVPPRYRSSYFLHIWGNGYSAGYYAYLWTEMLSENAFNWFKENGGLTRENGQRYREMILSIGNTKDLAQAFKDLVGHEPTIEPLLESRGL